MTAQQANRNVSSSRQLLLESLEKRWKNYRAEIKRCRAEFSNEAVHDVRIALRRLLSLIQLLNSLSPRPRLRKLSRALKLQLDEFDDLRDIQVMLAEISETIQEFPQLHKFQGHLERVEKDLLRDLRKKIKKPEGTEMIRRIHKTRESLKNNPGEDMVAPIFMAVDDTFLIAKQRSERIDPAQPVTIHRVRIAFKTFRYMVEMIHPLLYNYPQENLKLMNNYQSLMGEIQDLEILIQTLVDFPESASSPDFEPVHRYYELRLTEAISDYLDKRDILNNFWRPSPDGAFPWEKTK
jgi:CHAD domain-containing protein